MEQRFLFNKFVNKYIFNLIIKQLPQLLIISTKTLNVKVEEPEKLGKLEVIQRLFTISFLIWTVVWSRHIRRGWLVDFIYC